MRDERDLRRLHDAQIASALFVFLLGLYELNNPGRSFIPGWIGFEHTVGTEFNTRNVRIGYNNTLRNGSVAVRDNYFGAGEWCWTSGTGIRRRWATTCSPGAA